MKIKNRIHRLRIEFDVTPDVRRFVYIYIIEGRNLYLIDSGVDGAEKIISAYLKSIGRNMTEVKAILLTHSHPDHIGAASKISQVSECKVYACAGERAWIENIDRQFHDRPIPNFYRLVNQSVVITDIVREGDTLCLEDDITIRVINAGGHSPESMAYLFIEERVLFTGDAIPAAGDLPIYISAKESLETLNRLAELPGADLYLPAWDEPMDKEVSALAIRNAVTLLYKIDNEARETALLYPGVEPEAQFKITCEKLGMTYAVGNPLFRISVLSSVNKKIRKYGNIMK